MRRGGSGGVRAFLWFFRGSAKGTRIFSLAGEEVGLTLFPVGGDWVNGVGGGQLTGLCG